MTDSRISSLLEKGQEAFRKKSWADALSLFEQALEIDRFDRDANYWVAATLISGGDFANHQTAIKVLRSLMERSPGDEEAGKLLAGAIANTAAHYNSKKSYDESIAAAKEAISIDDSLPSAHLLLGAAYIHKEMWSEAIAACANALALKSDYSNALSNQSFAYLNTGQLDEAKRAAQRALQLNPGDRLAIAVLERLPKT